MFSWMDKRRYQLKKRAQDQLETRQRIVDATVELHREVGPARATISAIAKRAGVQRLTVYRHFDDNLELLRACSQRNNELNPPPDPAQWHGVADPLRLFETVAGDLYAYYGRVAPTLEKVLRDAQVVPEMAQVMAPMRAYLESAADLVVGAWSSPGQRRRILRAAVRHALDFHTWQSFRQQGLDDRELQAIMGRFVAASVETLPARD
jgi:AcrR family transcriptional regulator